MVKAPLTDEDRVALNRLREAISSAVAFRRNFGCGNWRSREALEKMDLEALEHVRKRLEGAR